MATFSDFLFTKDLVDFDLKRRKQAEKIAEDIEDEERKKSRNALIGTILGSLINPAVGIAAGIGARRGTDFFMRSEEGRVTADKYTPSETADLNKQFRDITKSLDRADLGKDLTTALSVLMLGGLSKNIEGMGILGGLKETAFQPGLASKFLESPAGSKLFPSLFGDWSFGGGG